MVCRVAPKTRHETRQIVPENPTNRPERLRCWPVRPRRQESYWSGFDIFRLWQAESAPIPIGAVYAEHRSVARALRRLPADWQAQYGVTPLLVETFVDPARYTGAC